MFNLPVSIWRNLDEPGTDTGNIVKVARSVRLNTPDQAYLSSSYLFHASDRRRWTLSLWVKRGAISPAANNSVFAVYVSGTEYALLQFRSGVNDDLDFNYVSGGVSIGRRVTTMMWRDPAAWYHVVLVLDTPNAVANDRIRMYYNGRRVPSFSILTNPAQNNAQCPVNSVNTHIIGAYNNLNHFSGYLAQIHFIDGLALEPGYFAKYDANNVWQPAKYNGLYGVNGFHLDFSNNTAPASSTTIGKDQTGIHNLLVFSADLTQAPWLPGNGASLVPVGAFDPYGTQRAYEINVNVLANPSAAQNVAVIADSVTTFAVYLKPQEISKVVLYNNSTNGGSAKFDLVAGTVSDIVPIGTGSEVAAAITAAADGWWQCSVTVKNGAGTPAQCTVYLDDPTTTLNAGLLFFRASLTNGPRVPKEHMYTWSTVGSKDWTPFNISLSAGSGYDSSLDSPSNNFCVINPLVASVAAPLNGNLDCPVAGGVASNGTIPVHYFNSYWEVSTAVAGCTAGIVDDLGVEHTVPSIAAGKTYGFHFVKSTGTISYRNVTDAGTWTQISTGLGLGTSKIYFVLIKPTASSVSSLNAGQLPYVGAVPAGAVPICTDSFPTPPIKRGDEHMISFLRAGTGAPFTVSGMRFPPGLIWTKSRASALDHVWFDTARGANADMGYPTVADQVISTTGVTAFHPDGFDGSTASRLNVAGGSMVHWMWRKSPASGFNMVLYTGDGTAYPPGRKVAHGMGVKPGMIIIKAYNTVGAAVNWVVYHGGMPTPATERLLFDTNDIKTSSGNYWAAMEADTQDFGLGPAAQHNKAGDQYIAYVFAPVPGFSAFGSYLGNGLLDGPFVWTGFRPQWVMTKNSAVVASWQIFDSSRTPRNPVDMSLYNDINSAEVPGTDWIDFTSNGFKLIRNSVSNNGSGNNIVYAAFAECPFKYARAR